MLLFSYGSNHPAQLSERLARSVTGHAAVLPGYCRVFRGYSERWQGGVASLEKGPCDTFGYVAVVDERDLAALDRREGVPFAYRRKRVMVRVGGAARSAVAYVATSKDYNRPSRAYLEAVAKTVGRFWLGRHGRVTWKDFPLR
jgi:gamma-glutamylcyclotransferase (GGCT)/AIG2-like uncharacterized protein YtfP